MQKKSVILDVDTGIDDALAISLASYLDNVNIKLITTIAGNLNVGEVTKNTLNVLQAIRRRRIIVAKGCIKPLKRKKDNSIQAHGKKGLGHYEFPLCELKPIKTHAVDKMYDVIKRSKEKIIIVSLGPLTNIARLLIQHPDAIAKIEYVLISGGLLYDDYEHPYLGYNIMQDPEAADYVMTCGVNVHICPSNHGHDAFLTLDEVEKLRTLNKTGEMFEFICRSYKDRHVKVGVATHDPCAIAYLSHPEIFKKKKMYVNVRFLEDPPTGVLNFNKKGKANAIVATKINIKKFKKLFFETYKKMP